MVQALGSLVDPGHVEELDKGETSYPSADSEYSLGF
jgi:hypothetical protein